MIIFSEMKQSFFIFNKILFTEGKYSFNFNQVSFNPNR
jgi:hypothetical protein